jgi:hypothetical protein
MKLETHKILDVLNVRHFLDSKAGCLCHPDSPFILLSNLSVGALYAETQPHRSPAQKICTLFRSKFDIKQVRAIVPS